MSVAYGAAYGAELHASFAGPVVAGTLAFTPHGRGQTRVEGVLTGLSDGPHGMHVHASGDVSGAACANTGDHFDAGGGHVHGGAVGRGAPRHAGDMGNIVSRRGEARVALVFDADTAALAGRSVVVHASADDLGAGGVAKSLVNGNSGARVACARIVKGG